MLGLHWRHLAVVHLSNVIRSSGTKECFLIFVGVGKRVRRLLNFKVRRLSNFKLHIYALYLEYMSLAGLIVWVWLC